MSEEKEHVTFREFDAFKDAVVAAIADASSTVNGRFDSMERRFETAQRLSNDLLGIVKEQGTTLREHERRLNSHSFRHARKDDPPAPSPDSEPLTMKDLKRAGYVAMAVLAVTIAGVVLLLTGILEKRP